MTGGYFIIASAENRLVDVSAPSGCPGRKSAGDLVLKSRSRPHVRASQGLFFSTLQAGVNVIRDPEAPFANLGPGKTWWISWKPAPRHEIRYYRRATRLFGQLPNYSLGGPQTPFACGGFPTRAPDPHLDAPYPYPNPGRRGEQRVRVRWEPSQERLTLKDQPTGTLVQPHAKTVLCIYRVLITGTVFFHIPTGGV